MLSEKNLLRIVIASVFMIGICSAAYFIIRPRKIVPAVGVYYEPLYSLAPPQEQIKYSLPEITGAYYDANVPKASPGYSYYEFADSIPPFTIMYPEVAVHVDSLIVNLTQAIFPQYYTVTAYMWRVNLQTGLKDTMILCQTPEWPEIPLERKPWGEHLLQR